MTPYPTCTSPQCSCTCAPTCITPQRSRRQDGRKVCLPCCHCLMRPATRWHSGQPHAGTQASHMLALRPAALTQSGWHIHTAAPSMLWLPYSHDGTYCSHGGTYCSHSDLTRSHGALTRSHAGTHVVMVPSHVVMVPSHVPDQCTL